VMTPERRHNRAKKNTVETPVSTKAHHCQLPATPYWRTCCVTQLGVSLLNVVATMDNPASHQGTERPEAKNSEVLLPARRPKNSAGAKQIKTQNKAMIQSMRCSCMMKEDFRFATRGQINPRCVFIELDSGDQGSVAIAKLKKRTSAWPNPDLWGC